MIFPHGRQNISMTTDLTSISCETSSQSLVEKLVITGLNYLGKPVRWTDCHEIAKKNVKISIKPKTNKQPPQPKMYMLFIRF